MATLRVAPPVWEGYGRICRGLRRAEHGAGEQQTDQLVLEVGVGLGEHLLEAPARDLVDDARLVGTALEPLPTGERRGASVGRAEYEPPEVASRRKRGAGVKTRSRGASGVAPRRQVRLLDYLQVARSVSTSCQVSIWSCQPSAAWGAQVIR